jgi:hypothetical protein
MTDTEDLFRSLDRVQMPELWGEAMLRAAAEPQREMRRTGQPSRPALLLAAALLLVLAIGGSVLVLSRIVDPPVLPDSSAPRLAYELDGDIYLADVDGGNPVRIADGVPPGPGCGNFWAEGSMWSPDGRYLAYRSACGPLVPGAVYLTDADGHPVASFPGGGWLVSWSPDSTRIATWVEAYGPTIGIHGLDGERQVLLTVGPECHHSGDWDPVWSIDGQSVVTPACELPLDGGAPRDLARDDPHRSWYQNAYSADGTLVAYVPDRGGQTEPQSPLSLVIAEADGTELQRLTYPYSPEDATVDAVIYGLVWSPSGDRLAFTWIPVDSTGNTHHASSELHVVDVASGLDATVAVDAGIVPLAFSPDGGRVLYSTHDPGGLGTGLWSIGADGSNVRLLVPGAGWGDWQPVQAGPAPSSTPVPTMLINR